jgi:hypothetical protein
MQMPEQYAVAFLAKRPDLRTMAELLGVQASDPLTAELEPFFATYHYTLPPKRGRSHVQH